MDNPSPGAPRAGAVLYHLGIDGGGSGTRARLADRSGTCLGEGRGGASSLAQGVDQAWRHVEQAVQQALQSAGLPQQKRSKLALGLGLAGANHAGLRAQFLQANPGYACVCLESDAYTALLGAHGGDAGAMLAIGTGSVGLARLGDGSNRSVGGWGFPSGDEGSGAWLGLRAANMAQRASDGRQASTALSAAVLATCGSSSEALLAWCCQAGQAGFATLAPLVFDCEPQDAMAGALLQECLQCMEQMAQALDPEGALPLAVLGSIGQRLAPRLPAPLQARLRVPRGDAMAGALALLRGP